MTKQPNGPVDRIESAANITLVVSRGATAMSGNNDVSLGGSSVANLIEVPISRLDTTKEVEISEIRESSLKASGYSITSISYSGTMMFKGSRLTKEFENGDIESLSDILYDDHGVPVPVSISIDHELAGKQETYEHVLVTSESYEVRSEEATETAFDWVAMDRQSDQPNSN